MGLGDEILQDDGYADGRDQRRQPGGRAQRAIGHPLGSPAPQRGQPHGGDQGEHQGQRHRGAEHRGCRQEGDQRNERAHHVDRAMGEIDHAQHAVNHGVAKGDQTIDGAQRQSVYQLLEKILHSPTPADEFNSIESQETYSDGRACQLPRRPEGRAVALFAADWRGVVIPEVIPNSLFGLFLRLGGARAADLTPRF
ncbi:protein of unknown function [Magnetospirillum sp. XM-1]|nr:protein of unknown function [Magnetospirillum sp. XM-1]